MDETTPPTPKTIGDVPSRPHTTHHHACDCREAAFERLRLATERLLAFVQWGMSPVERDAAIHEAKDALEGVKPGTIKNQELGGTSDSRRNLKISIQNRKT